MLDPNQFTMEEQFQYEKFKRTFEQLNREQAIAMCISMLEHMIYQDKVHKQLLRKEIGNDFR